MTTCDFCGVTTAVKRSVLARNGWTFTLYGNADEIVRCRACSSDLDEEHPPKWSDIAEMLNRVLNDVSGGDWSQQPETWQLAAKKARRAFTSARRGLP